jgi:hypothetical protein
LSNAQHDPALSVPSADLVAAPVAAVHPGSGWRRSSFSGGANNCVEARPAGAFVAIRDSKKVRGPVLAVDPAAWTEFLGGLAPETSGH